MGMENEQPFSLWEYLKNTFKIPQTVFEYIHFDVLVFVTGLC